MKKLGIMLLSAFLSFSVFASLAMAEDSQRVRVHGLADLEINDAITLNGSAMVSIRSLATALGMELIWLENVKTVVLWNDAVELRAVINNPEAQINSKTVMLSQAPVIIDGYTYLPLRNVAEAANAEVVWDAESNVTDIYIKNKSADNANNSLSVKDSGNALAAVQNNNSFGKEFYSQPQAEWGFANKGSGYCWVCAYAMAITSATGRRVTPPMVAAVNAKSGSGAYMQHANVVSEFGVSFTSALEDSSPYFGRYDSWRGATYIKASDDSEAIAAIKAALDKNPQGVMVRYTVYPHTIFAVGYSGDTIYFHEPAYENGAAMTFDQTCLKKYKISDLDYLQAIVK